MTTLATNQKAPILDGDGNHLDMDNGYAVHEVIPTEVLGWGHNEGALYAIGASEGTATITVVRLADGEQASLEVTVEAPPFTIQLGDPEPK